MEKMIEKTPQQVTDRLNFWYLKYFGIGIEEVTGSEMFTIFDKLAKEKQNTIKGHFQLGNNELCSLILWSEDGSFVLCTTHRFVHFSKSEIESIKYSDFKCHDGFKSLRKPDRKENNVANIKVDGYYQDFGLRLKNGSIKYWKIPTGKFGYAFWNVTKKFELIGRKYAIR